MLHTYSTYSHFLWCGVCMFWGSTWKEGVICIKMGLEEVVFTEWWEYQQEERHQWQTLCAPWSLWSHCSVSECLWTMLNGKKNKRKIIKITVLAHSIYSQRHQLYFAVLQCLWIFVHCSICLSCLVGGMGCNE